MRFIITIVVLIGLGYGTMWVWKNQPCVRAFVQKQLHLREFYSLETKYSQKKIIDLNHKAIFANGTRSLVGSKTIRLPYLLLKVKYISRDKTEESDILWDMEDGEMVIDANNWQKTHGLEDCLNANASTGNLTIVKTIAQQKGVISYSQLSKILQVDNGILDRWINGAMKKNLIIQSGTNYRLHFAKANLNVQPKTPFKGRFITSVSTKIPKTNRF